MTGSVLSALAFDPVNEANSNEDGGVLLVDGFQHFARLLVACQDYARLSGFRFSNETFKGVLEGVVDFEAVRTAADETGPWLPLSVYGLVAECRAAPAVGTFARRLHAGEPGLVEELHRSSRIVVSENVRQAMIAAFVQCGMWPPPLMQSGLDEPDCSYEDTSAPLPLIAQRAYNYELQRAGEAALNGGVSRLQHRAQTAFFLVSFGEEIGVPIPAMPDTYLMMLEEFAARVAEWEEEEECRQTMGRGEVIHARAAFLRGLGTGAVADMLRAELGKLWEERRVVGFQAVVATIDWIARLNPMSFVFSSGFVLNSFTQSGSGAPTGSKEQTPHAPEASEQPVAASVLKRRRLPTPVVAKGAAAATDELDLALVCASLA